MTSKALDLARLAADERTPIHEREAAALALAKIVARDGLTAQVDPFQAEALECAEGLAQARFVDLLALAGRLSRAEDANALRRENAALVQIAKDSAATAAQLREDLEKRAPQAPRAAASSFGLEGTIVEIERVREEYANPFDAVWCHEPRTILHVEIETRGAMHTGRGERVRIVPSAPWSPIGFKPV